MTTLLTDFDNTNTWHVLKSS